MGILIIVFGLLSLIFGLVFLIDCIKYRKQINAFVKYGIALGLLVVALDTAILSLIPNFFSIVPLYKLVLLDFAALVRITVFTCMGMYCCSILNVSDTPAIRILFREAEPRIKVSRRPFLVSTLATIVLAVGYSVVLFKLTSPQISEWLKQLSGQQAAKLGGSTRPSLLTALVVLKFAFAEEIIFRLGIQNYLAKQFKLHGRRYWISIVLTTLFWSLAHANMLDPEWVKIAQVIPLGLALGFLFRRYGAETCIVVHGVFNVAMTFLSPYLITT